MSEPRDHNAVRIVRLAGDFATRRSVALIQFGCCCCCCLQTVVGGAVGFASGLLLPAVSPLRRARPAPWMWRIRLLGAAVALGVIQGTAALLFFVDAGARLGLYAATAGLCAVVSGALLVLAMRVDRAALARHGVRLPMGRLLGLGAALGLGLGSLLASTYCWFSDARTMERIIRLSVSIAAALGACLGWWLVRRDRASAVQLQPRLASAMGSLIGANLLATLFAVVGVVYTAWPFNPEWAGPGVLAGMAAAGVWSAVRCAVKARQSGTPLRLSYRLLVVATDILIGGATVFAVASVWTALPSTWAWATLVTAAALGTTWLFVCRRSLSATDDGRNAAGSHPVCPHCGYALTGLTASRCPECGQPFDAEFLQQLARPSGVPITMWHPLSTSPIGGAVAGACMVFIAQCLEIVL